MIAFIKQFGNWMRRIFVWLCGWRLLGIAVLGVLVSVALAYFIFSTWEPRFRIAGMFLQLLGVVTVALGLRETRKLFSQHSLVQLAWMKLSSFPKFYQETRIHTATADLRASGDVAAIGASTLSASASIDDRVSLLERKMDQVNLIIQEANRRIDEEAQKQASSLEQERQERETEDAKNQKLLQEALAGGLHLETIGVIWLSLGITLATASVEIARCFPSS